MFVIQNKNALKLKRQMDRGHVYESSALKPGFSEAVTDLLQLTDQGFSTKSPPLNQHLLVVWSKMAVDLIYFSNILKFNKTIRYRRYLS